MHHFCQCIRNTPVTSAHSQVEGVIIKDMQAEVTGDHARGFLLQPRALGPHESNSHYFKKTINVLVEHRSILQLKTVTWNQRTCSIAQNTLASLLWDFCLGSFQTIRAPLISPQMFLLGLLCQFLLMFLVFKYQSASGISLQDTSISL